MKRVTMIALGLCLACAELVSADEMPKLPVESSRPKMAMESATATVRNVFAADVDGARYRAYLVQWKGFDVVVSDLRGSSDEKEGDTISFVAQRIEVPVGTNRVASIHFFILDAGSRPGNGINRTATSVPQDPEEALASAKNERERFYALGRAAKQAFNNGNFAAAMADAEALAALAPAFTNDWNYGNAIQDSNVVLGRLALRDGNIVAAKAYLVEASKSPGSPQMNSFGPNLTLAKDLLQKGEKDVVIDYLNACKTFWRMENGRLEDWIVLVRAGRIPDFGANLLY